MIFVAIPIFSFFYLFEESKVRRLIIKQLGNDFVVEIDGLVSPELGYGVSLDIDNLRIKNKQHQELLYFKKINCKLSWWKLLLGNYKITEFKSTYVEIGYSFMSNEIENLLSFSKLDQSIFSDIHLIKLYTIKTHENNIADNAYKVNNGKFTLLKSGNQVDLNVLLKLNAEDTEIVARGKMSRVKLSTVKFSEFQVHAQNSRLKLDVNAKARYNIDQKQIVLEQMDGKIKLGHYTGIVNSAKFILSPWSLAINSQALEVSLFNKLANQRLNLILNKVYSQNLFRKIDIDQLNLYYVANFEGNNFNFNSHLNQVVWENNHIIKSATCNNNFTALFSQIISGSFYAELNGSCNYNFEKDLLNLVLNGTLNKAPLKLDVEIKHLTEDKLPSITVSSMIDRLNLSNLKLKRDRLLPFYYDMRTLPLGWC